MNVNPILFISNCRTSNINKIYTRNHVPFGNLVIKEDVFTRQASRDDVELDKILKNQDNIVKSVRHENYLGSGANVKAFLLDSSSDEKFIIKIPHTFDIANIKDVKFQKIPDALSSYNFGQPVAQSKEGIFITKFVQGKTYSVPDIVAVYFRMLMTGQLPTREEAQIDLASMKKIARFPLEAYIDLAKKFKKLNSMGKCVDYINPNNLLIDEKNKKINVIDIWEDGKWNNNGTSGYINMVMLLCNGWAHKCFLDALNTREQKEYKKATREIINKCKIAARIEKLPPNEKSIFDVASYVKDNVIGTLAPGKDVDMDEGLNWFFDTYKLR